MELQLHLQSNMLQRVSAEEGLHYEIDRLMLTSNHLSFPLCNVCACLTLSQIMARFSIICCFIHCNAMQSGFSGPFWRNTLLAVILSYTAYQISGIYTPAAQGADIEHSHSPTAKPNEADDESKPFLTRYIAYHMPRESTWKQRNDKHLELSIKAAEDKLLLSDAQRPKIRRLRYPGMFEQASPHCAYYFTNVKLCGCTAKWSF